MARRYTRDNRGRFSSVGATARGGRLRTEAGNKRATQTERLAGGRPAGTVGKASGRKAVPKAAGPAKAAAKPSATRIKTVSQRPGVMKGRVKRDPDAMETHKANQRRRDRIAKNMAEDYRASDRIFGYKWEQIQAAQRGDKKALRRYLP